MLLAALPLAIEPVAFGQTAASPVAGSPAPRPAQIDHNSTLMLIRSVLIAVHQGNVTGNYTVLRDIGAPAFRDANSASRLAEIFAKLRDRQTDLSGTLVLEPQLTIEPRIEPSGQLHVGGYFPSVPVQVNFELLFSPVAGRWEVFGIAVNIGPTAPAAPVPPPAVPVPSLVGVPGPIVPLKQSASTHAKSAPKPAPKAEPKSQPQPQR